MVKVEVKWQKEVFKDVEIDLDQGPAMFKMQLFSLTGVPPERQKIMGVKGGLLKDDADLHKLGLKEGQKLTMMGTADPVPEAPKAQQTFVEDLPEEEQDTTGAAGMPGWGRMLPESAEGASGLAQLARRGSSAQPPPCPAHLVAPHILPPASHPRLQAWGSMALGCRTWATPAT